MAFVVLFAISQSTWVLCDKSANSNNKNIENKSDTVSADLEGQGSEKKTEKRGLYGSYGDFGSSGGGSYGGGWESHGHDEHVKTVTIEKKVPVPVEVIKKIPYYVEKHVSIFYYNFSLMKIT